MTTLLAKIQDPQCLEIAKKLRTHEETNKCREAAGHPAVALTLEPHNLSFLNALLMSMSLFCLAQDMTRNLPPTTGQN